VADHVFDALKRHLVEPGFVYAVGYSLEKLHSGVLAQMLKEPDRKDLFASLWKLVSPDEQLLPDKIVEVKVTREHKLGKGCVIDLFAVASLGDQHYRRLFCEYKVDGTGDHDVQCARIKSTAAKKYPPDLNKRSAFALVTPGGAAFWDVPCEFRKLDIVDLLQLLQPWESAALLVKAYLSALRDEELRRKIVGTAITLSPDARRELGYRGYDVWYDYYGVLKPLLPNPNDWRIFAASHNAVMTWEPSWQGKIAESRNPSGWLYCEMSEDKLCLKIHLTDRSRFGALISAVERSAELVRTFGLTSKRRLREPHEKTQTLTLADRSYQNQLSEPHIIARSLEAFVPDQFLKLCDQIRQRMDSPN